MILLYLIPLSIVSAQIPSGCGDWTNKLSWNGLDCLESVYVKNKPSSNSCEFIDDQSCFCSNLLAPYLNCLNITQDSTDKDDLAIIYDHQENCLDKKMPSSCSIQPSSLINALKMTKANVAATETYEFLPGETTPAYTDQPADFSQGLEPWTSSQTVSNTGLPAITAQPAGFSDNLEPAPSTTITQNPTGTSATAITITSASVVSAEPEATQITLPYLDLTLSLNGKCGPDSNTTCGIYECCSEFGYCGSSDNHCLLTNYCQTQYGMCKGWANMNVTESSIIVDPAWTQTATAAAVESTPTNLSPDGHCGPQSNGNYSCSGTCCSNFGFCGNGDGFCGTGCQEAYGKCSSSRTVVEGTVSSDRTCGSASHGNYTCGEGSCCSPHGFCGCGEEFCGAGCQAAFGECDQKLAIVQTITTPVDIISSSQATVYSPDGTCGNKSSTDGTVKYTCPNNQCCGGSGYCGVGFSDYCDPITAGCDSTYGNCSQRYIPSGSNTSSISRDNLGVVPMGAFVRQCSLPGYAALLFEDGPFQYTEHILDLLKQYGAKATFFITGNNLDKGAVDDTSKPWVNLIKRMYDEGHQIASKSWTNPNFSLLSDNAARNQMYLLEMALRNILGKFPSYMKPPGGSCDAECLHIMGNLGYHVIAENVDTADSRFDSASLIQQSKDRVSTALSSRNSDKDSAIISAHDTLYQTAYNLTESMLQTFRDKGYKVAPIGTCLNDDPKNWYRS